MSKLNFRIVENYTDDIDFDELVKDYLDPTMTLDDICRKHDISRNKYYQFKKRIVEETGVEIKPCIIGRRVDDDKDNRYIYKIDTSDRYRVVKTLNQKTHYFGVYDDYETAEEVRDLLIAHDWDVDYYLNEIKPKYHPTIPLEIPFGFEDDYLKMPVDKLRKKYGLSEYQFCLISMSLKSKLGITRKPMVRVHD